MMNRSLIMVIIIILSIFMIHPVLSAVTGSVKIITEPTGVEIALEGKDLGVTPLMIPNLQYGNHSILLTKTGYESQTEIIQVQSRARTLRYVLSPVQDDIAPQIPSVALTKKIDIPSSHVPVQKKRWLNP